ncbi:MAG: translation initiation factor IF-2 subunit gamma [Nanoarchaeota archaeon]
MVKDNLTPEISIGLIGHVDHGKTTLTQALSGKWTDTHSEELKRGITIRLGYADAAFYYCKKCKKYSPSEKCSCKEKCELKRKVSFIDAPGHETLMATMLSGAAIMDYALLLIAASENCPQPQTREHLMALDIIGIKNIIIVQNKIDLVDEKTVLANYEQIKKFVKGTIAENAPIIPISAQHKINIDILIETIEKEFKTPKRDLKKDPLFFIARSFDINKPGSKVKDLVGGILGGSIKQGTLKVGDKIEIRPGLKTEKENQFVWEPVITEIEGLHSSSLKVKEITPGGSSAILTKLDPSIVKSDNLTGNVVGLQGKIPPVWYDLTLKPELLKRVVGAKDDLVVEPIKKGEVLMLNVNSSATVGIVNELKKDTIHAKLKIPVCADKKDRVTISRQLGNRWRLIGFASIES